MHRALILALAAELLTATAAPIPAKPDAQRLRTGRFTYRTLVKGQAAGQSEISILRQPDDTFRFTNTVTGEFSQQWEAVTTRLFAPISAKLTYGEGDQTRPAFELNYKRGSVTGFVMARNRSEQHSRREISARVPLDIVDQRIDWAAALSLDLVEGREYLFHVYDASTGSSRVSARVAEKETVVVPAGTFEAIRVIYRIEKSGQPEIYQALTNREGRRMLLREEFPNGAIIELVAAKE